MDCPCGKPGKHRMWEAHVELCDTHAREWFRSMEKGAAKLEIEGDNEVAALEWVRRFCDRIRPRKSILSRIWGAICG